ncbi:MAG: dihydroorotate dehydrogenase electron transfer subunit [Candidatus Bathycorpusculaceae bacterium]
MSACRIAANTLRTRNILKVKTENSTVKTFTFKDKQCSKAKPGQFLMIWIPKVDEIPLSILETGEDATVSVAVKNVGEATKALHGKKAGEIIGVRGPFGNSFTIKEGKILMVGGGTGVVPLLFLAKRTVSKAVKLSFVMGAKTKEELLFTEQFENLCDEGKFVATTEDGSYGIRCLVTEPLERLLVKEKFHMIYACGPEQMVRKVFDLAEKYGIDLQVSLERLMRCAIGLCGSCIIGRYRVCKDGPVFTREQLRKVKDEFGVSKRGFDGRKTPV